ncbi:ABC transporter C member 13 [Coemansia sp. RSA 2611]|nr:ABC transporter C member 13 [Coemansia sp. RSA 2611]
MFINVFVVYIRPPLAAFIEKTKDAVLFTRERHVVNLQRANNLSINSVQGTANADTFVYNVDERGFLLRAILRMVWQPMWPLYIADSVLQLAAVAELVLDSYMMQCLDSDRRAAQTMLAASAWLLAKIVSLQRDRVSALIAVEWARVAKAIESEFQRLPLQDQGLRNLKTTNVGRAGLDLFIENLRSMQATSAQLVALAAGVVPVYRQIGVLIVVPFAVSLIKRALDYAVSQVISKDTHVGCTGARGSIGELHRGIRAVKMFGWEPLFLRRPSRVGLCLNQVYGYLTRAVWSVLDAVDDALDHVTAVAIVYLHARISPGTLAAADVFWIGNMLDSLRGSVSGVLGIAQQLHVTVGQYHAIEQFLRGDFVRTLTRTTPRPVAVEMRRCSFRWSTFDEQPVIDNTSMRVDAGELVAVGGATGAGKSALLLAVCGELEMTKGNGHVAGSIGYMEQTPWILNDSLRANILFGRAMDADYYKRVLHACAFIEDLSMWPDGDLTAVGDRGVNISGGQRARLALARALYARADVYVLDDPLSAVDAHVKRHIMEHVILDTGLLRGKTRFVAANTKHVLPFASQVVEIENGQVSVRRQVPAIYKRPCLSNLNREPATIARRDAVYISKEDSAPSEKIKRHLLWDNLRYVTNLCTLRLLLSTALLGLAAPVASHMIDTRALAALAPGTSGALLQFAMLRMSSQALGGVLAKLGMCAALVVQQRYVATRIRHAFMQGMVHAPLSLFDSTTATRLSSAYQDGVVDLASDLSRLLRSEVAVVVRTLLAASRVARSVPLLLLVAPVAAWASGKIQKHVQPALESLQELIGETSYEYCALKDAVDDGGQLIRLARAGPHFTERVLRARARHEAVASAYDGLYAMRAAGERTVDAARDVLVVISVIVQRYLGVRVNAAVFLQYRALAQELAASCALVLDIPAGVRASLRRVDTLRCFADLPPEAPYTTDNKVPSCWPQRGQIEFRGFSMRYRPDLGDALNNINLTIQPGEHIGIVRRTGAGKSSLVRALFRMVPEGQGAICIDGQDVSEIGLADLRPRLGIIPQESVMLGGSFRQNIDPLGHCTIEDLWAALIQCKAAALVSAVSNCQRESEWQSAGMLHRLFMLATGTASARKQPKVSPLDKVVAGSTNLSSGQQQLLSLCRLLAHGRRQIVVLDEATADVDLATERNIQQVIRTQFKHSTVLTIAHRLETVMESDRIVVMDRGRIVEVGPPAQLLKQNGFFAELVKTNDF